MNIQNLNHHIEDIKYHHRIQDHNIIFLSETWLSDTHNSNHYHLPNYSSNFISIGNGKGLAAFSEPTFQFEENVFSPTYQMTKYSTSILHWTGKIVPIEVISLYRSSSNTRDVEFLAKLQNMITKDKISIICGDFNIRYQNEPRHFIIQELLNMHFLQQIDHPTHTNGGIIDHFYMYRPTCYDDVIITWELFCPFYTDHFAISIIINKQRNHFQTMPSTIPDHLINNGTASITKQTATRKKQTNTEGTKRTASSPMVVPRQKHKQQ